MSELIQAEAEGFRIDTDQKADWALGKIKEMRQKRDEWVAWYAQKTQEIKEQTDFETMNLERMLAEYFRAVPHKKTKTQESYKLPGGKLVMKTQNPGYVRDDKAVIAWAKANKHPEYVKVKEELDWEKLKGATEIFEGHIITEDGEIVPGVEVEAKDPKFIVEV